MRDEGDGDGGRAWRCEVVMSFTGYCRRRDDAGCDQGADQGIICDEEEVRWWRVFVMVAVALIVTRGTVTRAKTTETKKTSN